MRDVFCAVTRWLLQELRFESERRQGDFAALTPRATPCFFVRRRSDFCGSRCGTRCLVARLPSASAPDAGPTAAALPPKDQCGSAVRSTQAPSAFPGTRGSRRCKSGTCRWRLRRIGHTRNSGVQVSNNVFPVLCVVLPLRPHGKAGIISSAG